MSLHIACGSFSGNSMPRSYPLRLDASIGMAKYVWITKGVGRLMLDGVTRSFGPNTAFFIPPNLPHQFELATQSHYSIISIAPDPKVTLLESALFVPILNIMDQSAISVRFDSVQSEYQQRKLQWEAAVFAQTNLLGVEMARLDERRGLVPKSTAAHRLMQNFSRLVESQYFTGKTLADFAAELSVTPTHLTRVSQQMNGKSASNFIQDRILNEARSLLAFTDEKINAIAKSLGFSSAAYFTRFFNSKTAQTPKQFRQSLQQRRAV